MIGAPKGYEIGGPFPRLLSLPRVAVAPVATFIRNVVDVLFQTRRTDGSLYDTSTEKAKLYQTRIVDPSLRK